MQRALFLCLCGSGFVALHACAAGQRSPTAAGGLFERSDARLPSAAGGGGERQALARTIRPLGSKPAECSHVCTNCGPPPAEAAARRRLRRRVCSEIPRTPRLRPAALSARFMFRPQPSGRACDLQEQPSARGRLRAAVLPHASSFGGAACEAHATSCTRAAGLRGAKLRPADVCDVEPCDAVRPYFGAKPAERSHVCTNCGPPRAEASARRAFSAILHQIHKDGKRRELLLTPLLLYP